MVDVSIYFNKDDKKHPWCVLVGETEHLTQHIYCHIPMTSQYLGPGAKQPKAFLTGQAWEVIVKGDSITIR